MRPQDELQVYSSPQVSATKQKGNPIFTRRASHQKHVPGTHSHEVLGADKPPFTLDH